MFKKSNKLTRSEFSEYFKKGRRNNSSHLTIITLPFDGVKVSVVVGKKVAKSAVRRNTLKRRVYAIIHKIYQESNFSGVMIVVLKPSFNTLPRRSAESIIRQEIAEVIKSK